MKKQTKTKSSKSGPALVTAMAKLVERIETLEKKTELTLEKISALPSEIRQSLRNPQQDSSKPSGRGPGHRRTWYEAVCSGCGKLCEVPFEPIGERPVYCKTCYAMRKASRNNHGQAQGAPTPPAQQSSAHPSSETAEKTAGSKARGKAPKNKKTPKKKKK